VILKDAFEKTPLLAVLAPKFARLFEIPLANLPLRFNQVKQRSVSLLTGIFTLCRQCMNIDILECGLNSSDEAVLQSGSDHLSSHCLLVFLFNPLAFELLDRPEAHSELLHPDSLDDLGGSRQALGH